MTLSVTIAGVGNVTDQLSGLAFSNVDPGGFEQCTFTLTAADAPPAVGARVTVWEGLSLAWLGEVDEIGQGDRRDGRAAPIRVAALGAGAELKRRMTSMVYVDRDLDRWGPPPGAQALDRGVNNWTLHPTVLRFDDGADYGLHLVIKGAWATPAKPMSEAWYDAGAGNSIGSLYYAWKRGATMNAGPDTWSWQAVLSVQSDHLGTIDPTADLQAAGPADGVLTAAGNGRRYANVQVLYDATAAGTPGADYVLVWTSLIVFGDHSLTKRGAGADQGLYASDIARHAGTIGGAIAAGTI